MKQGLSKMALRISIILMWSDENPYAILQWRHQHQFFINVWAGIEGLANKIMFCQVDLQDQRTMIFC
jgi:hypothetical protein